MGCEHRELSVLITDDSEIASLNGQYRGKPKATDVLSFAFDEGHRVPGGEGPLGDIVISLDTAARQARDAGVRLQEELERLLIHGLLHLLGYDHEGVSAREAAAMRRKERLLHTVLVKELGAAKEKLRRTGRHRGAAATATGRADPADVPAPGSNMRRRR